MRENFWQFFPTHTAFLSTNHRPEVKGTDHAIWRRIKLVPFEVTIPEAEQDKKLAAKLRAELPGILSWIVRGCLEWQRYGLGESEEVKAATTSYRDDMDNLAGFIQDRCVVVIPGPASGLRRSTRRTPPRGVVGLSRTRRRQRWTHSSAREWARTRRARGSGALASRRTSDDGGGGLERARLGP
jgi:hypothetical protein